MADIVSAEVRSRMMAGIRGKNTRPELLLRSRLHAEGFRFRLHDRNLPGKPDIVFRKYNAVLFFHGCFWHGHDCALFRWPATRPEFWRAKIDRNRSSDASAMLRLLDDGWRYGAVWECALRGPGRLPEDEIVHRCAGWLRSGKRKLEIRGLG